MTWCSPPAVSPADVAAVAPRAGGRASPRRAERLAPVGGAVLAGLIALALFLQFSIDDVLKRDEAIYAYGGQQLVEGVAPYASVFDPKTPLGTGFAAVGVVAARAAGAADGAGDVHGMRILFLVFAVLAVLAVYALGLWLWDSALAALAGAVVFCSFHGFALDAIGGPNAKTPAIFLAVLAMALLVRRWWFWGALAGSLAFLVWQPLGGYVAAPRGAAARRAWPAAPAPPPPGRRPPPRRPGRGGGAGAPPLPGWGGGARRRSRSPS